MEKGLTKMTKAIAKAMENAIESANDVNFQIPTGFINTFDLTTNEGKMKVVNATNNSVPLNEYMDTELHICDCVTMPGVRKGRNGMPDTECKNVHLIDDDGVSYFSQSDGVARAVQMFAAMWPDFGKHSTVDGYLAIKCISQVLPNGNTLKTLVFVNN